MDPVTQTLHPAPVVDPATVACTRCGYGWTPRYGVPAVCAGCGSPYWNRPRVRRVKKQARQRFRHTTKDALHRRRVKARRARAARTASR